MDFYLILALRPRNGLGYCVVNRHKVKGQIIIIILRIRIIITEITDVKSDLVRSCSLYCIELSRSERVSTNCIFKKFIQYCFLELINSRKCPPPHPPRFCVVSNISEMLIWLFTKAYSRKIIIQDICQSLRKSCSFMSVYLPLSLT